MTDDEQGMEVGALIGAAVTDLIEAVSDLVVDPRERVRIAAGALARLPYPTPERERQAAGALRSFQPRIEEAVTAGDALALQRVLGDVAERCRRLALPARAPSVQDDLREWLHAFLNASWSTEEAEAIKYFARAGDRIGNVTPSTVRLGNRELTRAEVREELARRGWNTNYLVQLRERERRRIEVDAGNRERAKKGLGPIHYTGGGLVERA